MNNSDVRYKQDVLLGKEHGKEYLTKIHVSLTMYNN